VTKGIRPNLTILLNCSVDTGLERKASFSPDADRFEQEDISFHRTIRNAYLKLSKEDRKRFFVVDGGLPVEKIHEVIKERVEKLIKSHGI